MTITQEAQDFFGARCITISGSRQLWGRTFMRRYDLTHPQHAKKALQSFKRKSAQVARWKEASTKYGTDLDRWPTPGHYFLEMFMDGNSDHELRNPCTFLRVMRHRKW